MSVFVKNAAVAQLCALGLALLPQQAEAVSDSYVNFPDSSVVGWAQTHYNYCCFTNDRFATGVSDFCPASYWAGGWGSGWGRSDWGPGATMATVREKYERALLPDESSFKLAFCSKGELQVGLNRLENAERYQCLIFLLLTTLFVLFMLILCSWCIIRKRPRKMKVYNNSNGYAQNQAPRTENNSNGPARTMSEGAAALDRLETAEAAPEDMQPTQQQQGPADAPTYASASAATPAALPATTLYPRIAGEASSNKDDSTGSSSGMASSRLRFGGKDIEGNGTKEVLAQISVDQSKIAELR